MTYVDVQRTSEGQIMLHYVVWIYKATRDAKPYGFPEGYVDKYIRPHIPPISKEARSGRYRRCGSWLRDRSRDVER